MKIKKIAGYFILVVLVGEVLGLMLWVGFAAADDVYNFYFQKGPAPQSVIQTGSGQSTSATKPAPTVTSPQDSQVVAPTPAPAEATTAVAAAKPAEGDFLAYKPFTFTLGGRKTFFSDGSESGISAGLQYNFNQYLGIRAQVHYTTNVDYCSYEYAACGTGPSDNPLGGSLALAFSPFRLEFIGHRLLELSVFGGVTTYTKPYMDYSATLVAQSTPVTGSSPVSSANTGVSSYVPSSTSVGFAPMAGISALVAVNANFGVEAEVSRNTQAMTTAGLNLAFQF